MMILYYKLMFKKHGNHWCTAFKYLTVYSLGLKGFSFETKAF